MMSWFYIAALGLIVIGLYIVLTKKNLIKIVMGLGMMETGTNILLISIGYINHRTAPIYSSASIHAGDMVDPVPQALVLTAIVIGVAVLALALSVVILIYKHFHTLNIDEVRDMKW